MLWIVFIRSYTGQNPALQVQLYASHLLASSQHTCLHWNPSLQPRVADGNFHSDSDPEPDDLSMLVGASLSVAAQSPVEPLGFRARARGHFRRFPRLSISRPFLVRGRRFSFTSESPGPPFPRMSRARVPGQSWAHRRKRMKDESGTEGDPASEKTKARQSFFFCF